MSYEDLALINNEAIHNFELLVDGHRAFIDYRFKNNKMYLIHTEVPIELKGKGVGEAIVLKTLKYIEQHGYELVPMCTYVQLYLKRHPDWQRLV